jgi:hypothetical protein
MTPAKVLQEYRRQSPEVMQSQMKGFRQLSIAEQRELLFWMMMHLTADVKDVHSLVQMESK